MSRKSLLKPENYFSGNFSRISRRGASRDRHAMPGPNSRPSISPASLLSDSVFIAGRLRYGVRYGTVLALAAFCTSASTVRVPGTGPGKSNNSDDVVRYGTVRVQVTGSLLYHTSTVRVIQNSTVTASWPTAPGNRVTDDDRTPGHRCSGGLHFYIPQRRLIWGQHIQYSCRNIYHDDGYICRCKIIAAEDRRKFANNDGQ